MRRTLSVLWLMVCLLAAALLPMQSAWAHAQFLGSDPASDTTLENSPHEIVLTFSGGVTPVSVTLVGPDDAIVETVGEAIANAERVVLPVTEPLDSGNYVVSFRVLSGDAHPISGGIRFSIAPPPTQGHDATSQVTPESAAALPAELSAAAAVSDRMPSDIPEKTIRVTFMLVLGLAVGLVVFRRAITLPGSLHEWVVTLTRRTAYIGLILAVAYFLVTTLAVSGVDGFRPRHLYVMLQTSIGMSLLVAVIGFMMLSMSGRDESILTGIGAVTLVASRVLTGHPVSQEPMLLLVPAMAVHIAAAAFWFASLWVLLRFLRKGPLAEAPQLLGAFARIALWSVSALLAVGLVMAAIHLKSFNALLQSEYGQTLLWKLGGVAGLLILAAVNKLVLTPDVLKRFDARRLKISIRIEALLMIFVIAVSTLLAATPPVMPYDETQSLSLELFDASGNPFTPLEVSATFNIPSRRIEAMPLTIQRAEGNHLVIKADFPNLQDTYFEALVPVTDFDRERFAFNREGPFEQ